MQDANSNEYEGRSVGGVVGNKEKQIEPSSAAGRMISTAKLKYEKTFSKIKVKQLFESFLDMLSTRYLEKDEGKNSRQIKEQWAIL